MKILHVIPSVSKTDGGPSQAVLAMCRALKYVGTSLLLVTTDSGMEPSTLLGTEHVYDGVPTRFFPTQQGKSFKYSAPLANWLKRHVPEFDLVHIHAVFNHSSLAAARACRRAGVPYMVRPLGTLDPWSLAQKSWRKKLFLKVAASGMLRDATAIHCTSQFEKEAIESGLSLRQCLVVPLGIETGDERRAEIDLHFRFPMLVDQKYILMLSRLLPTKGVDLLLDVFLSLVQEERFRNWRLVLAGTGPDEYVDYLHKRVNRDVAADFVIFTGWVEGQDKKGLLQHASFLALPSEHENFGLCVMESLALGVPVLISRNVSLASEVETTGAGWLAETGWEGLHASLCEAMSCERERSVRGANGKKLAARFSWPIIATSLKETYSAIIEQHRTGRLATQISSAGDKRQSA